MEPSIFTDELGINITVPVKEHVDKIKKQTIPNILQEINKFAGNPLNKNSIFEFADKYIGKEASKSFAIDYLKHIKEYEDPEDLMKKLEARYGLSTHRTARRIYKRPDFFINTADMSNLMKLNPQTFSKILSDELENEETRELGIQLLRQ